VELAEESRLQSLGARALLDHDPGDPLLASVALRVAERTRDSETAKLAGTLLAFVQCTGNELP
jgi:hypothetical protein